MVYRNVKCKLAVKTILKKKLFVAHICPKSEVHGVKLLEEVDKTIMSFRLFLCNYCAMIIKNLDVESWRSKLFKQWAVLFEC